MFKTAPVLLSGLVVVLAGCGAPSAPSLQKVADAQLPGGYVLASADKYGISIGVPIGWRSGSGQTVDPKDEAMNSGVDTSSASNPDPNSDLGRLMADQEAEAKKQEAEAMAELEAKGIVIHVIDASMKPVFGEDPTHFSVTIKPNPSSSLEAAAETMLERVPGEEKPVPVTIPAGPAMLIRADKKMRDGGEVTTAKYVLQDGKTMIVVAFVTEADPSVIRTIEDPVIQTLRVVPGKAVPPAGASGNS